MTTVYTDGPFYAYIHSIQDDVTWRFTLIWASRDVADQWWRAVSTSTNANVQASIQRIAPQFYTHDPLKWNIYLFFGDTTITTLAAQFRGKFFMTLENDRGGRGITVVPPQTIVDNISGKWFSIRSKADPSVFWYYDDAQGFIVTSTTQRSSFQITAPDLANGGVMIGTDDITITPQFHGYINPDAANANGGSLLRATAASSQVAFRFKFSDLKSGRFSPNNGSNGAPVLYTAQGGAVWELVA